MTFMARDGRRKCAHWALTGQRVFLSVGGGGRSKLARASFYAAAATAADADAADVDDATAADGDGDATNVLTLHFA